MKKMEILAKELNKELKNEKDEKKRLVLLQNYLYRAYVSGFLPQNLGKYERIDERYPKKEL